MNVSVFLASTYGKNPLFSERTAQIGHTLAKRGHHLIFGGSNTGLMKVLCDSFLEDSDQVLGVEPDVEFIRKNAHPGIKNLIYTNSMAERKHEMISRSDAVIVMPGGPGSLDEAGDVLQLMKIATIDVPLVFVNTDGFYDPLKVLFENMNQQGFFGIEDGRILFSDDVEDIMNFIKGTARIL